MQSQTESMTGALRPQFLEVGPPPSLRRIAYLRRAAKDNLAPANSRPGIVWLGGFMSNMRATKASFLDAHAAQTGQACLRFDYSGHGESDGQFAAGTIGDWLEESLAAIRTQSTGPQILVGSSMGGWLALLCARRLADMGEAARIAGMVLIAPATDMTERLIYDALTPAMRAELTRDGRCLLPSSYADQPYPIAQRLIEEGRSHLLLDDTIRTYCPVHILQGMEDTDVSWQHAMRLVEHLAGDPVRLTLVKDADHRFSRPADLALLAQAVDMIVEPPANNGEKGKPRAQGELPL